MFHIKLVSGILFSLASMHIRNRIKLKAKYFKRIYKGKISALN